MLPKKRKFDLSKFGLDRGGEPHVSAGHGGQVSGVPGGVTVTVTTAVTSHNIIRPPDTARAIPSFLSHNEPFSGNTASLDRGVFPISLGNQRSSAGLKPLLGNNS